MVLWNGKTLADLNRYEIETVAAGAIQQLVTIREIQTKRQQQDNYILTFALGIIFTLVACFVGASLH